MKKSLVLIAFFVFTTSTYAQVQKISAGIMLPATATTSFPFEEKPFQTGFSIAPSFNVLMPKLHTHLMYNCTNNSVQSLVGYVFKDKYDVYLFGSKNLNTRNSYLGLGLEKALVISKNLVIVLSSEFGSNLKGDNSFTVGATVHPQLVLWKKK